MLALLLALAMGGPCETGCDERGCWLLVYRYSYTSDKGSRVVDETFDGRRFPTEGDAECGAEKLRKTGVWLPTLSRYGRDSNVIPEAITPMPHLLAVEMGIRGVGTATSRPESPASLR